MIKFKYASLALIFGLLVLTRPGYSSFIEATFDDIREHGGFHSDYVRAVCSIKPSGENLSASEKNEISTSPFLTNVHSLYLQDQNLDDEFIENLCANESLKRLINLDVSDNGGITNESLKFLLESVHLGSVRDLPQVSGRFGTACTVTYVKAKNTSIIPPEVGQEVFSVHAFDFSVQYIHPTKGTPTDKPVDYAVKIVECLLE